MDWNSNHDLCCLSPADTVQPLLCLSKAKPGANFTTFLFFFFFSHSAAVSCCHTGGILDCSSKIVYRHSQLFSVFWPVLITACIRPLCIYYFFHVIYCSGLSLTYIFIFAKQAIAQISSLQRAFYYYWDN